MFPFTKQLLYEEILFICLKSWRNYAIKQVNDWNLMVKFSSALALTSITIFCTLVVSGNGGGLFRSSIFGIGESSMEGSDIVRDGIESEKNAIYCED